jgi:hypothetical protein
MMELPLYMKDAFGHQVGLVLGVTIGFGFGFVLERSGFGRGNLLAAQFYFTDMRVLKVMFTSIVTALLGITILSGVGVLDVSAIAIPTTYIWPHLFGGLLLGMGFIVSGYCPGTGVVAMASGKLDGLFAIFGVMLGAILFGFSWPLVEGFYQSGDLGVLRFPELLGINAAWLALGVTAMAIGAFIGSEKLERMFSKREPAPSEATPIIYARLRRGVFTGLAVVAVLGMATIFSPQIEPAHGEATFEAISPLEFAQLAIEDPSGYYLVDLRVLEGDGKRIPGALSVTAEDPEAGFVADFPSTRMLVFYGRDTLPESAQSFEGDIRILEGGYVGFSEQILTAPTLKDDPTTEEISTFRLRSALHAYFTGSALSDAPAPPRPKKQIRRATKKEGGC